MSVACGGGGAAAAPPSLTLLPSRTDYKVKPKVDCGGFGPADTKTCINTPAGVASLVAAIPFAALFSGYLSMVTVLPQMSRERASFYRERFSKMYSPEIHGLAYFLSELPYVFVCTFFWYDAVVLASGVALLNPRPYLLLYQVHAVLLHVGPPPHAWKILHVHADHGPESFYLDRHRPDRERLLPHRRRGAACVPPAAARPRTDSSHLCRAVVLGALSPLFFMFCGVFLQKSLCVPMLGRPRREGACTDAAPRRSIPEGASSNPQNNHPHIYFQWCVGFVAPRRRRRRRPADSPPTGHTTSTL